MNNTICENLIPFRDHLLPIINNLIMQVAQSTTNIMNAYADLLNNGTATEEDQTILAELRHHHNLIMHSLTHEADVLKSIGKPRKVEKYFNFENGDLVEVTKDKFVGLPESDEA